jgi:DNA repair exonuclease SbcCD ATPase subunit
MRILRAGAALALALGACPAARAQEMYRWLDAQGRVHYGSEPPADARSVTPWSPDADRMRIEPRAPPAELSRPPEVPTPGPAPTAEAPAPETIGGRTEAQWRQESLALEARVQKLERELDELEDSTQAYGGWGVHREKGMHHRVDLPDRRKELEKQLDDAQSKLDRLEEEARRLGVPPGWLR